MSKNDLEKILGEAAVSNNPSALVGRLLTSTEVEFVSGGSTQSHTQTGPSPFTQGPGCQYTQNPNQGGYQQTC